MLVWLYDNAEVIVGLVSLVLLVVLVAAFWYWTDWRVGLSFAAFLVLDCIDS